MKIIFFLFYLSTFVYSMEDPNDSFNEDLAKLLIKTYTMKTFKTTERELCIKEITELSELSKKGGFDNKIDNDQNLDINKYNTFINNVRNSLIKKVKEIYNNNVNFQSIGEIYTIIEEKKLFKSSDKFKSSVDLCQTFSKDIDANQKEEEENIKHINAIKTFMEEQLKEKVEDNDIAPNLKEGANKGFILTKGEQTKYFIKTFSEWAQSSSQSKKKIDCRELFAYKVLELMEMGPETHFLINRFSSSQKSFAKGCYIVTKNVSFFDKTNINIKNREFLRDCDTEQGYKVYHDALENNTFQKDLLVLVSLSSILRIKDSLGENTSNYGIVKTEKQNGEILYTPVLIDHLPYTSNGFINNDYSPGAFLKKKLTQQQGAINSESNLRKLIEEKQKDLSSKSLNLREQIKKTVLTVEDKIKEAKQYVLERINQNSDAFADEDKENGDIIPAQGILERHVKGITQNYETFKASFN